MKSTDPSSPSNAERSSESKPAPAIPNRSAQDADRIARRAYEIWDQEGRPTDRAEEHWIQAERELFGKNAPSSSSYAKVEELSRQAYAHSDVPVAEQKKHWLEAEAYMRRKERAQPLPPSKAPPPEEPIEPVEAGIVIRKE